MVIRHPLSSYKNEQSDSYMCVPACLNMIFRRRGMATYPQIQIAYALGLKVPLELKSKYPNAIVSNEELDWGVHPRKDGSTIEQFLKTNNIHLISRYFNVREIPHSSMIDFLSDNIKKGNDILVGYNYFSAFQKGLDVGHVSLVESIDTLENIIGLIDPEDLLPVKIKISNLLIGIFSKNSGFWVFGEDQKDICSNYVY